MPAGNASIASDPQTFRRVLGHFPTGVVAITSLDGDGKPTGMAVGSFTSVSLDPPLVAFLPDKSSSTFPKIRENGRFCVNVLGAHQQRVCAAMSIKGGDKFASIAWTPSTHAMPRIHDSVAWLDCEIENVYDAGDHHIVVGRVDELGLDTGDQPLIFFQGGYGRFASTSLSAPAELDLYRSLTMLESTRPFMEAVADEFAVECCASTVIGTQQVLVGSCIPASLDRPPRIQLGTRMPFTAPLGTGWAAWLDDVGRERWMGDSSNRLDKAQLDSALERVRERGWSLVLHSPEQARLERAITALAIDDPDPAGERELKTAIAELTLDDYEPRELAATETHDIRHLSAPVFDPRGNPALLLSIYQAPRGLSTERLTQLQIALARAGSQATEAIGGRSPG
ncbi:flavin reductase [Rhodococcus pyridinivorans]|uniref:flavin reductase n=1 Tax=Rhodococcus pyridinivorans TaxID=103816 RepID=UPI0034492AE4